MGAPPTCILVLGMHRSGTSALARVISLLGAALPAHLLPPRPNDNETGFWEPQDLWSLHDGMLAEAGSRWDDWRSLDLALLPPGRLEYYKNGITRLILEEYADASPIVLKEPRICRFVPLYSSLLAGLGYECRYVLALRNPLGVIASLARRNRLNAETASLLWLRHMLDAEAATRGMPRAIVSYEALVDDWRATVRTLGHSLEIDWPRAPGEAAADIANFLARELRHFAPSVRALQARDDIVPWVKDAYGAFLRAEHDPGDATACAVLDRVRADFDAAARAFGAAPIPAAGGERSGQESRSILSKQLEEKEACIQRLVLELENRQQLIAQLAAECEERLRVSEERRELIQRLTDAAKKAQST